MTMNDEHVLETRSLTKIFHGARGDVTALDDVSFSIPAGKTLALVGESGSGKTTAARLVLGLDTQNSGTVKVLGKDLSILNKKELRNLRRSIQVVQQNPYSQLNRRHSVQRIVETPLLAFNEGSAIQRRDKVVDLLESVGLDSAYLNRRPHELSGGQCQRVAIARALATDPRVLILDDATAAIDPETEDQLRVALRSALHGRTTFVIAHRVSTVRSADLVLVLERGRIVQQGTHAALTALDGPYRQLVESQLEGDQVAHP
jgi:peptide/nickel transport system ATP-binding protein